MNIYADRGNLLLLERRCAWRGIGFRVLAAGLGEAIDPGAHDLFYIGGAQDRDQALCAQDMVDTKRDALHAAADAGKVVLAVCGGYQLLGHHYELGDERIPGVGLVDLHTIREDGPRLIGNVAIEVRLPGIEGPRVLAGFENHGGRTYLGAGEQALGRVLKGHGNTGASGFEGVLRDHVVGTYLHGPLLPKNAWFADWLIATAMRLVNRMIEMSGGDILLDGRSVRTRKPADLRREIGYAIQQIGLFPHQTIADNIATVPRLLGWPRERIRARVDELIELIGLDPEEMRGRYPAQLSGGQRQRVGVARALAADPPLMLMDEPFGAIDPINRERLQNEFLRLQAELRKTIVFVTHDIDEAIKVGDRIAVLKAGGVLAQYATPPELLMQPADEFVEDFVGADRALKRRALTRVGDVRLWDVDAAQLFELLTDDQGRPVGWQRDGRRRDVLTVARDAVLRDALSDLLRSEVQYGAVLDEHGRVAGLLGVEIIHDFLEAEVQTA